MGVEAFRAGEYTTALQHFEAAERSGAFGTRAEFNLGSTLLELGRYDESRSYFERIANDLDWGALAKYNLGLIAECEHRVVRRAPANA